MRAWEDNPFPYGFLITFRTYGSWLHGDQRGSIDRYHNKFGGERIQGNSSREAQQAAKLKSHPVKLNAKQRKCVEFAIRDVCAHRGWKIQAINIRTNHVHVVVSAGPACPENVLRDFKAYATRALRSESLWPFDHSPWNEGGSKRYLWNAESLWNACDYVINRQGDELPDF